MIKINLLDSVTERQGGATVAVERRMSSPASRLLLMTIAVMFLLTAVVAWDVVSTQMAKAEAERQLEEQKRIAVELEAVTQEMKELEQKIQNIDTRIDAIKKLRASQAGPSAVLEAVTERIAMTPGLYLESIEQTGEQMIIKGNSPDESAVTQFGRSLEFSGGLFSNLNIETQRKEAPNQQVSAPVNGQEAPPKQEIVGFTIRCAYTPSKAGATQNNVTTASNSQQGANTVQGAIKEQLPKPEAQPNSATPPQVAKN
jgi:Tfp pilus assembly protein PilN